MKRLHWFGVVLLALAFAPAALPAQQSATIVGRVIGETGVPLGSASVSIPALNLGTLTRALGLDRGQHPVLSFAKLRAAWGEAGNEPPVYGTITTFTALDIGDGGWNPALNPTYAGRGGLYSGNVLGQENLRPERTTEIDEGLDFSLLRDRV